MSGAFDFPTGTGNAEAETRPARVSLSEYTTSQKKATHGESRFMFDKIMPMSEAVEGYVSFFALYMSSLCLFFMLP